MTAIVMKCLAAGQHPNAESLRVYTFGCERGKVRIVANMENVYEAGDNAIIVLANCMLNDEEGTKIRVAKIRGCRSHGMAIGKTELPVNTDVSTKYCEISTADGFKEWPSIGALANVRKDLKSTSSLRKVTYKAKIKLDGTNSCVQVHSNGDVLIQSRPRFITPEDDNMGFAKWVDSNKKMFKQLASNKNISIYGEYCGSGIQSNSAAIAQIGKKIFAIFAVQIEDGELPYPLNAKVIYEPKHIMKTLEERGGTTLLENQDVYVLPWASEEIGLDFTNIDTLKTEVEVVNKLVAEIEACDPWVKKNFNIEGVGEGVVMYPVNGSDYMMREDFVELLFKAKGEAHKVTNTKQPAQIDPEVAASIDEFVALFVTENRLNQIASQIGEPDMKLTGSFVKAFVADVQKESTAELEASNLDWKQVAKAVSGAASSWWRKHVSEF